MNGKLKIVIFSKATLPVSTARDSVGDIILILIGHCMKINTNNLSLLCSMERN